MKFTPKAESELSTGFSNLPPGRYPFTVIESSIAISKSAKNAGKEMVKVKLCVHGDQFDKHVYDYFSDWFSEWKLKHFCETTGKASHYSKGEIDPSNNNWQSLTGYVKINEDLDNKDQLRNVVDDYLPEENQKVNSDDIPF